MITAFLALMSAATPVEKCDFAMLKTDRSADEALSRRVVEIVSLAAIGGSENEARLATLVDPAAPFGLDAGDVGRPLGKGVVGITAMAQQMNADEYRFLGWDDMAAPANACGKKDVSVEFVDGSSGFVSQVKFSFDNGRLIGGQGWQRSFQAGVLPKPSAH